MILVADASAFIALATCDSLALLDAIFGNVLVVDMKRTNRRCRSGNPAPLLGHDLRSLRARTHHLYHHPLHG